MYRSASREHQLDVALWRAGCSTRRACSSVANAYKRTVTAALWKIFVTLRKCSRDHYESSYVHRIAATTACSPRATFRNKIHTWIHHLLAKTVWIHHRTAARRMLHQARL